MQQAALLVKQQGWEHPELSRRSPTNFSKINQDYGAVIARMKLQVQ
jgi:hypothetical protein